MGSSPRRLRALLGSYAEAVARAPEGTRHLTLLRYALAAYGLVGHGLAPEEAEAALLEAALASGLPEGEARDVLRWARQVGRANPCPLSPPLPPSPRALGHEPPGQGEGGGPCVRASAPSWTPSPRRTGAGCGGPL